MNSWRRRRGVYDMDNVAELQRRRHFDKVSGVLSVKVQARGFAQRGGSKKGEPIQVVVANTKMSKFGRAARTLYEADSNMMVMLGSFMVDGLGSRSSCLPLIWGVGGVARGATTMVDGGGTSLVRPGGRAHLALQHFLRGH